MYSMATCSSAMAMRCTIQACTRICLHGDFTSCTARLIKILLVCDYLTTMIEANPRRDKPPHGLKHSGPGRGGLPLCSPSLVTKTHYECRMAAGRRLARN